ncbi:MAG: hypothetical protein EB059_09830, partial [Alphaproteobacteria bacterium]|nr:hypothetical protein [Alphaproteobacteria bacterium]
MLTREPVNSLVEITETQARPLWATWLTSWQSKLHDAKQSIHGLLRKPMAVQLPTNDRKMSIALAAMLATLLYVCALALLVHFVLGHAADGMDTGIRSSMTVEILSATSEQKDWKSAEERLKLVQERLRKLPGVIKAENVPA